MDDYRDPSLPTAQRVDDLLSRMSVAEKAALMFHPSTELPGTGLADHEARSRAVRDAGNRGISHFNVLGGEDSAAVARWHNQLQGIAANTRLGIPITLSSDPRHQLRSNPFTGQSLATLSRWPETTGIAAIGTIAAARDYGNTVREEFLAMGIRVFLGPMADVFSEPRWSRGAGTFGEDPDRVGALVEAFVKALRGSSSVGPKSVAAVVKHFPGAGPQLRGDDAHDPRYPEQVYPGGQQELHLRPFERAFAAGVTQVMTYYGQPIETNWDEVGFAFNAPVIRNLLRRRLGFNGIVMTDWNLLEQETVGGLTFGPNAWGLLDRTPLERARIAIEVGVDQFGGERNTTLIEELVDNGLVNHARLDESARRLLREKFQLGLFEQPFIDESRAEAICGSATFFERGIAAQRESLVLFAEADNDPVLASDARVYFEGVTDTGDLQTTETPLNADAIVVRLDAPFTSGRGPLGDFFQGGTLAFADETIERLRTYSTIAPLFVVVFLERPAILEPIIRLGATVMGDFGSSDAIVLDALRGRAPISGTSPFDIPSSMIAIERSREDVPFDTADPTYRAGHGIQRSIQTASIER